MNLEDLTYDRIRKSLKNPVIFDGRNQYDSKRLLERGFDYICIGKQPLTMLDQRILD